MTSIRNMLRVATLGLAIVAAAAVPTKKAHADGGAVVAGIAGGLILGSIIGSTAQANSGYYAPAPVYSQPYYAPAPRYYAPAPRYYAPRYYAPPVSLSFGYSSGHRYHGRNHYRGHSRHYRGKGRHYRDHRSHRRGQYRGHRRHYR